MQAICPEFTKNINVCNVPTVIDSYMLMYIWFETQKIIYIVYGKINCIW